MLVLSISCYVSRILTSLILLRYTRFGPIRIILANKKIQNNKSWEQMKCVATFLSSVEREVELRTFLGWGNIHWFVGGNCERKKSLFLTVINFVCMLIWRRIFFFLFFFRLRCYGFPKHVSSRLLLLVSIFQRIPSSSLYYQVLILLHLLYSLYRGFSLSVSL